MDILESGALTESFHPSLSGKPVVCAFANACEGRATPPHCWDEGSWMPTPHRPPEDYTGSRYLSSSCRRGSRPLLGDCWPMQPTCARLTVSTSPLPSSFLRRFSSLRAYRLASKIPPPLTYSRLPSPSWLIARSPPSEMSILAVSRLNFHKVFV